ncbi:MAG: hypothetical protein NE334_02390 [Lentisphaeraceae bacterium]|nr:hypothetical protein [Lentisphaeraceae bacterium]
MNWLRTLLALNILLITQAFSQVDKEEAARLRRILSPYLKVVEHDQVKNKENAAKILLGKTLFYDTRLSGTQSISCNSCHDLKNYGSNGEHYKKLVEEGTSFRDVPSIYNKADFELFNWDGSQKTLKDQTLAAITNKHELAQENIDEMVDELSKSEGYKKLFAAAYENKEVSVENIVDSLVTFQVGLKTPAPIDDFLKGKDDALSEKQIAGGFLFDERNCFTCHTGSSFGGQMLQKIGVLEPWPNQKDLGYYEQTKNPGHKMFFRVSPLRNVEKTAPYFHDGTSKRLWDAIKKMGRYELGAHIGIGEVMSIQSFLRSLTGEIPTEYIEKPEMP